MGSSSTSVSVSPKRKKMVLRELVKGYQSASQLKCLLQNHQPFGVHGPFSAHELLAKIHRSFSDTLSVLTSSESHEVVPGEKGSPAAASSLDRGSQDSAESGRRLSPVTKDRRGCYKRRRTAQTWTEVSSTMDDNHAWRKYGQKEILNFKFPRSYFRCSRKYDQGCKAMKQVQRIQENPEKYQTTYIGYHTCKDILRTPDVVTTTTDSCGNWEAVIANSDHPAHSKLITPNDGVLQVRPFTFSLSACSTIKQKSPKEEKDTPSDVTDNMDDPSLWSDLKDFELSVAAIVGSYTGSDHTDHATVYSCSGSLDFGADSVQFGSDFHLDEIQTLLL